MTFNVFNSLNIVAIFLVSTSFFIFFLNSFICYLNRIEIFVTIRLIAC